MIVNSENLAKLRVGFNASMQRGQQGVAAPTSHRIAMRVPSTTKEQRYGFLKKLPNVREWIGDRVVHNISESDFSIREKPWELTVGVDRDDIETDNLGQYALMFEGMGESTISKPEQLVWGLLKAGFDTTCYDGQYFFDTDHPVLAEDGVTVGSVANTDGGSGTPWFLLDVRGIFKPIIRQVRREFGDIVSKDKETDDNVFSRKEFVYGVDARMNVGFGFWQKAWGSKQTLDAAHYKAGFAALEGMKGDHGRPIGAAPNLLVVPPSLREAGLELLNAERDASGATNVWKGTAELLVVPWLA